MLNFGHCFFYKENVLYTMSTSVDLVSQNSLIQVNI